MKKLFTFLLIAVSAATVFAGNYPDISQADLQKAIADKKVVILDVNGTESYKEGHIPGAIDFVANKGKIATLLPADKSALIVAYCGSEKCGAYAAAAKAAADLGYTNVQHYKPGLAGWKATGEPLDKAP